MVSPILVDRAKNVGGEADRDGVAVVRDDGVERVGCRGRCAGVGSGFRVQGAGFRVQGSGFKVQGPGSRVQGSGFRVQGSRVLGADRDGVAVVGDDGVERVGCRGRCAGVGGGCFRVWILGSGFRVQGSGSRVQGPGFRVQGSGSRVQGPGSRVQAPGFRVRG